MGWMAARARHRRPLAHRLPPSAMRAQPSQAPLLGLGWSDLSACVLLLGLYTLQGKRTHAPAAGVDSKEGRDGVCAVWLCACGGAGIPMGVTAALPIMFQRKMSYDDQALLSLVTLPFSLKVLWAPIVDGVYSSKFGRRKTWLIPTQMIAGLLMVLAAPWIDEWIGEGAHPSDTMQMKPLALFCLVLFFLMATQDIAVDGWALTMLSEKNVGYASTCNTIGQSFGFFLSNVGLIALHDEEIANMYFREQPAEGGLLTLSAFLRYCGWVVLVLTLYVWFFKAEKPPTDDETVEGVWDTLKKFMALLRLPSIQKLCMILITSKFTASVMDGATRPMLLKYGVTARQLSMFTPVLLVVSLATPIWVGKKVVGPAPLGLHVSSTLLRIVLSFCYMFALWWTKATFSAAAAGEDASELPWYFNQYLLFSVLLLLSVAHEVLSNTIFVSQLIFFARISDPAIGGTYMTFLNTIGNLGSKWPQSLSLWLMSRASLRYCGTDGGFLSFGCMKDDPSCTDTSDQCESVLTAYDFQVIAGAVLGLIYVTYFLRRWVADVHRLPMSDWRLHAPQKQRA